MNVYENPIKQPAASWVRTSRQFHRLNISQEFSWVCLSQHNDGIIMAFHRNVTHLVLTDPGGTRLRIFHEMLVKRLRRNFIIHNMFMPISLVRPDISMI